jgi:Flp pilus assembly protein TadD
MAGEKDNGGAICCGLLIISFIVMYVIGNWSNISPALPGVFYWLFILILVGLIFRETYKAGGKSHLTSLFLVLFSGSLIVILVSSGISISHGTEHPYNSQSSMTGKSIPTKVTNVPTTMRSATPTIVPTTIRTVIPTTMRTTIPTTRPTLMRAVPIITSTPVYGSSTTPGYSSSNSASKKYKNTAEAYTYAEQLVYQGKYSEAIAVYDWMLKMDPSMIRVWYLKGKALEELGEYDQALISYETATTRNPMIVEAWYGKANMYYELERYKEAVEAFDKAISLDTGPHSYEAYLKRSDALSKISPT